MTQPKKPFSLRMPKDLQNWVALQAEKERRSVNSMILTLIAKARDNSHAQ